MESNFPRNDNSAFVALSKDSKVGISNVYLAAFEYFRPGIMRFDRPVRIKHFMSCARAVDKNCPGYEVGFFQLQIIAVTSEGMSTTLSQVVL